MRQIAIRFALSASLLAICTCVADTMRSYIGQDIRQVQLAYGPPADAIDLGNGVRAYQWTRVSLSSTPIAATTTSRQNKKGREVSKTQVVGMQQTVDRCLYTFLTAWTPQRNGWIVTGIKQPSLACAVGDLNSD